MGWGGGGGERRGGGGAEGQVGGKEVVVEAVCLNQNCMPDCQMRL